MNVILQSERLLFREFVIEDAPLIFQLNSDPEVLKYVHELPPANIEAAQLNITNRILPQYIKYGYGRWAVFMKENNNFIGWCGLKYREERKEVDLGYRFIRSVWGKGYATEAAVATLSHGFRICNLPEIAAMAHVENPASLRVLEKAGMKFTGFDTVDSCPVKVYKLGREGGK